jgi:hypothetical protein
MNSQIPRKAVIAVTSHSAPFYPDGRTNGMFYTEVYHPYSALKKPDLKLTSRAKQALSPSTPTRSTNNF